MLEVSIQDFARSFGTTVEDIPNECRELINKSDFRYKEIEGEERDRIILDVLKKIESDQQIIGTEERRATWERGWEENLRAFVESNYQLNKIVPKFIRPNQPIRFNKKYIMPRNPNFEHDYFLIFRAWLFTKYLKDINTIYDFGCGSGFNLVALAQMYPHKSLHGLDFVPASRELLCKIAEMYGWDLTGHLFDMVFPDADFQLVEKSAVVTSGSIEQLASRFESFLQFILKQKPALCINIEPTIELYDENNLIDFLAMKFHRKRGYTENYLTRLRELEVQGKIEILKVKRLCFGSLYMEGFSYIAWKPMKGV
jgi:hypothetical protein